MPQLHPFMMPAAVPNHGEALHQFFSQQQQQAYLDLLFHQSQREDQMQAYLAGLQAGRGLSFK
jgi:hypothetical protein